MSQEKNNDSPWYKNWPEGIPKIIDIPNINLSDMLENTTKNYPEHKSIIFLDSIMNYRELNDYVNRFATALSNLGLKKGDVVAIMLPNSPQFVISLYGCQKVGIITTAINPLYKPKEVKHQLNDSKAKALIVLDSIYNESPGKILKETEVKYLIGTNIIDLVKINPLKKMLGKFLKKIPTGELPNNAIKFLDLLQSPNNPPKVNIDPNKDIAILQYTGGTTGTPKGAMLSARNLISNALSGKIWISNEFPVGGGYVGILPLFHIFALTCVCNIAIATGCFQLLFPRPPDNMLDWASQIEKWGRGTQLIMPGVTALFNKINNTSGIEKYDLTPLIKCLSGAGPLPWEVQTNFEKKTGAIVVEGYGLTESSPVIAANPFTIKTGSERVKGSIGIPFPNTYCKIMDLETGNKQMPYGVEGIGELCCKGPQVMMGYYNQPEETNKALRNEWLYTGDIAYMNSEGWLFIMDRAKDLIKHKGYSVFPKEVEEYMYSHPDILEVAIIGLPHPKVGEILKAYIVLRPESIEKITKNDIIKWCRENMSHYKVPSEIEFRDILPKTTVGKVLRRILKDEEIAKTIT